MSRKTPYIIGIAGGSGAGKTTVIRKIVEQTGNDNSVILQHDWYYRANEEMTFDQRAALNYDHPDSLETDLMVEHLEQLVDGRKIEAPQYDFSTHQRKNTTVDILPGKIIIIDGILILTSKPLRQLMDMKIYVDADSDLRFIRRLQRDVRERERSMESIINQYLKTVKPMHDRYVQTSKRYADVILPHCFENSVAINLVIAQIRSVLGDRG